ncbi:MAG: hypothetical protein ACPLTQ_05870 [Anaerolineae bacterium]
MGRQRGWLLLMVALLVGAISALALSGALAAPRAGFLRVATNLSNSPNRPSYYADIAVSPDGDRVVVVWPEAYQDYGGAVKGSVYLRWASESTGSGWSAPMVVHTGSSTECARWAAAAVTGTNPYTAVVAYITQSPCDSPTSQAVRYRLCPLGGSCDAAQTISASLPANDPGYGSVDVALDGAGQPHFAYAYYRRVSPQKDIGTVYYWSPSMSTAEMVSLENQDARTPAIAWNGGAVHVVWAAEPWGSSDNYFIIYYRRRVGGSWATPVALVKQFLGYAPHDPAVAVFSSTVLVAWDMNNTWADQRCTLDQTQCEQYTLAYIRSVNNGENWPLYSDAPLWYELGGGSWDTSKPYTSTGGAEEYIRFLRPSVGFRTDGKPAVVWHVNDGTTDNPDYNIYYTEALTVPENAADPIEWAEIRRFGQNPPLHSASPVVAPLLPLDALHVVYLQGTGSDWETYYDGNEFQNYSHVYLPIVMRNAGP